MKPAHIDLLVEGAAEGRTQPVEVEECGDELYRVLYSPGWVEGIAAGDVIRVTDSASGQFEVVERGGNIAIKWAAGSEVGPALDRADRILSELGARRDGAIRKAAVWTVPVASGFSAMESAMEQVCALIPGSDWWYGNVYDNSGKPLNWW